MARTRAPRGSNTAVAKDALPTPNKKSGKVAKATKKTSVAPEKDKGEAASKRSARAPKSPSTTAKPRGRTATTKATSSKSSESTAGVAKKKKTTTALVRQEAAESLSVAESSDDDLVQAASVPSMLKKGAKRKAEVAKDTEVASNKRLKLEDYRMCPPGQVLSFGTGETGQLGLGPDVMERKRPATVEGAEDVVAVAAGGMHTVLLNSQGEVLTFGCNDEGCLGRATPEEDDCFVPGKVNLPAKVVSISAGDSHSAALTETGDVYYWGNFRDNSGFIGLTREGRKQETPLKLEIEGSVSKIASGDDHLAILTSDNRLYTLGCGEQGQLGRVGNAFLVRGGRRGLELFLQPQEVRLPKRKLKFKDVWAGSMATVVLTDSNDVFVFGLNNYHQLSVPRGDTHVVPVLARSLSEIGRKHGGWKQVSLGEHYALALDSNGRVYAFGRCEYGRLGLGESETKDDVVEPTLISSLKDIKHIATGTNVSVAVEGKGDSFSWGMGTNMQLGHGEEDDSWVPRKVGGKKLEDKKTVLAAVGAQHTVLVAVQDS